MALPTKIEDAIQDAEEDIRCRLHDLRDRFHEMRIDTGDDNVNRALKAAWDHMVDLGIKPTARWLGTNEDIRYGLLQAVKDALEMD